MATSPLTIVCHIGNPKAWSTSIQGLLAAEAGDDLDYLGFRPGGNVDDWYADPSVAELFDVDLRFTTSSRFATKVDDHRSRLREIRHRCEAQGRQLWLSSEHLSSKFVVQDIDPDLKLARLQEVIDAPATFVLVVRNVWDALTSIHREYVKVGYTLDFEAFCQETALLRDVNFLDGLLPGHQVARIRAALRPGSELRWHALGVGPAAADQLRVFLDRLRPGGTFGELPRLNRAAERAPTGAVRRENVSTPAVVDSVGLAETHRLLWHRRLDPGIDQQVWAKLRRQREAARRAADRPCDEVAPAAGDTALGGLLRSLRDVDRELLRSAGDEPDSAYEQLWEQQQ